MRYVFLRLGYEFRELSFEVRRQRLGHVRLQDLLGLFPGMVHRILRALGLPGLVRLPVRHHRLPHRPEVVERVLLAHVVAFVPHLHDHIERHRVVVHGEALQDVRYLEFGNLKGAQLLILQPRRSAGTAWLDRQSEALQRQGAVVKNEILEQLREGYWARQEPTEYEIEQGQRLAELIWERLPRKNR